jgi:hypothetical protein
VTSSWSMPGGMVRVLKWSWASASLISNASRMARHAQSAAFRHAAKLDDKRGQAGVGNGSDQDFQGSRRRGGARGVSSPCDRVDAL